MSEILYKYEKGKGWVVDHTPDEPKKWYVLFKTSQRRNWQNIGHREMYYTTYAGALASFKNVMSNYREEVENRGWLFGIFDTEYPPANTQPYEAG